MTTYFFYDLTSSEIEKTSGKIRKKYSHNIVSLTSRVKNEIIFVDQIKELIPNCERHFFLFNTVEKLKIASINDTMTRMDSATEIADDSNILLTYDYKKLIYLDSYLKNLSKTDTRKYLMKLNEFYKSLHNSITKLVTERILHNNISLNNLIVDEDEEQILISNFGFATDIRREKFLEFCSDKNNINDNSPIEFHLLHYQIANNTSLSLFNIESIIGKCLNTNSSEKKNDVLSYFTKYMNKTNDEIMNDMFRFSDTWDNYTASASFLSILYSIHGTTSSNQFINNFMKLLESNIYLVPTKRNSLNNAIKLFNELVLNTNFKALLVYI